MGLAQELLPHRQGIQVEGFGVPVAPLGFAEPCQIIEAGGDIGMGLAQELLPHRQGLQVEGFGVPVAPLGVVVIGDTALQ